MWTNHVTELLWQQALAAVPLALIVAAVTRWFPCRPATRHALWVTALAWLVLSPFLPQAPSLEIVENVPPTPPAAGPDAATLESGLVLRQPSSDGLGGTVWRSQAVLSRARHGLPTASGDRATRQRKPDRCTTCRRELLASPRRRFLST